MQKSAPTRACFTNKGRRTQNPHNTPCEAYLHIMPTFMRNDTIVIMITVMLRLDQQKEKELVAAYSNAGNPVSQSLTNGVNCVIIYLTFTYFH